MPYSVAVVGATGIVGEALISILEERDFPLESLFPVASEASAGKRVEFRESSYRVESLSTFDFSQVQIAFFCVPEAVSSQFVPVASAAGAVVIDSSACFRQDDEVPMVVPEVNADAISGYLHRNLLSSPGVATTLMAVALQPLHQLVGIERIHVTSFHSVSESGRSAMEELGLQTLSLLNLREVKHSVYPKQIAFNVLPQVGKFNENGYTEEEVEVVRELPRVFGSTSILVSPTAVRVPAFYGHSLALQLETSEKITAEEAGELLRNAPGVELLDRRQEGGYPTAVSEAVGNDTVHVGRIREDLSHPQGLHLWLVADNVRKGAALNSVQIAEILLADYL